MEVIAPTDLPVGWDRTPFPPAVPDFLLPRLTAGYPALAFAVPSAVLPDSPSRNILLNPGHPRHAEVTIEEIAPLRFDERLRA